VVISKMKWRKVQEFRRRKEDVFLAAGGIGASNKRGNSDSFKKSKKYFLGLIISIFDH